MPQLDQIDQDHIDGLCEELRPLLEAELAAGNSIFETWRGDWPIEGCLYIMLAFPFRVHYRHLPAGLSFNNLNDLHHWKEEIICDRTKHVLACHY